MRGFHPYPAEVIASLHEDQLIYHFSDYLHSHLSNPTHASI